jgi:trimeric autotransporter adhesin
MDLVLCRRQPMACVVLLAFAFGLILDLNGCGAIQAGQSQSASGSKRVVSVLIAPQTPTMPVGNRVQFSATALFSDGSKVDISHAVTWISAQPNVASINAAGLALSKATGATTITAVYTKSAITAVYTKSAITVAHAKSASGSSTLTVTAALLVSISVMPQSASLTPKHSVQLSAIGTFTDGTTQDVSSAVTWSSSPAGVLSISNNGLATANSSGTVNVVASQGPISGGNTLIVGLPTLVSIALLPQGITLTPAHSAQLKAVGTYSDTSTQDISAAVTWSANPGGIVAVSSSGLATGKGLGTATVTAAANTVSATGAITVLAPTLTSISITSSQASIPLGENQPFSAMGRYNDGSTRNLTRSVQWASSDSAVLSFSNGNIATATAVGTTVVTATLGTVIGTTLLNVNAPAVISFSVAPVNLVLIPGASQQLTVLGEFSDGTTQDMTQSVSWSSANPAIARVSDQGLLFANQVGQTTISVASNSVSGSTNVTVKPVLAVSYFANAHTSGVADATMRLTNPGGTGGNLCAEIYVFDQDQQLSECCGCLVSPDGLRTLSVNTDLTGNPLTGRSSSSGVVKIVPADASVNPSCDPTAIAPQGSISAWSTNIQKPGASGFSVTETTFDPGPLGDDELAALQNQCSFASTLGSGQGMCSCGTGAANLIGATAK